MREEYQKRIEVSTEVQRFGKLTESTINSNFSHRTTKARRNKLGRFLSQNPKYAYPKELKLEAIKMAKATNCNKAAAEYKLARNTLKNWVTSYDQKGESAFDLQGSQELHIPTNWGSADMDFLELRDNKYDKCVVAPPSHNQQIAKAEGSNLQGHKNTNFITPEFRLKAIKEALVHGVKSTAANIGVNEASMWRWMGAYKTQGEEAHIFHMHRGSRKRLNNNNGSNNNNELTSTTIHNNAQEIEGVYIDDDELSIDSTLPLKRGSPHVDNELGLCS